MRSAIEDQKTAATKYNVRFVESFPINLPAKQVDLYKWIIEMTEPDYRSYSPAHLAMNSYFKNGELFMTNVEAIGVDMVIQHYQLKYHAINHVQLYSARSEANIMRWIRVIAGVPWEMQIKTVSDNSCELVCLVGADYPNLFIQVAAWFNGFGGRFIKKHLIKEGKAFAKDIETKFSI